MISKGLRGARLGGLVRYLFGPGRHEEHVNQRVVACSDPTWVGTQQPGPGELAQLIAELDDPMVRFGDRTKDGYVYHVVVSIPAEDGGLDDEQWRACAQEFAERLGMGEGVQWVAVHHGPGANGNDHIHMVANLIGDSGRLVNLWQDGMRRRAVCLELEERYGLRATSAAGLGEGSLSRREVEQVRAGQVATVEDLPRNRIATLVRGVATGARSEPEFVERLRGEGLIVRPRMEKGQTGQVVGYSVGALGGDADGRVVWYGGGTLGKDLRLPALRTRWDQTDTQRNAAKQAWASQAQQARKAEPRNLAGASTALRRAGGILENTPAGDKFAWHRAAADSAGLVAAAAASTTDERLRRELIGAWKTIHRSLPIAAPITEAATATVAVDVPATDVPAAVEAAPAQTDIQPDTAQAQERATAVWPAAAGSVGGDRELATLMGGAARVLMAARLADASGAAQVRALVTQAMQLAAQIARTMAAMEDATAAQQRAAAAMTRVAGLAAAAERPAGWEFSRTGAEVLEASRQAAFEAVEQRAAAPAAERQPDAGRDL